MEYQNKDSEKVVHRREQQEQLTQPEKKQAEMRRQALGITEQHFSWVKFGGSYCQQKSVE